jgi:hypothetical protein
MKRLIRHSLDYEKTCPYVRDLIHWGTPLTKMLLEKIDFSKGHFFVDLPEGYILSRIYDFKAGGISYKFDVGAEPKLKYNGKPYTPRYYMSTDDELDYFLKCYLDLDDKNIIIFDEYMFKAGDEQLEIDDVRIGFEGDYASYVLTSENSEEDISNATASACHDEHTVIVLSRGDLIFSNHFVVDNQEEILKNLEYIIVNAYDGEAYLSWKAHC